MSSPARKVPNGTLQRRAERFQQRVSGTDAWTPSTSISLAWKAGYAAALRDHKPRGRK